MKTPPLYLLLEKPISRSYLACVLNYKSNAPDNENKKWAW